MKLIIEPADGAGPLLAQETMKGVVKKVVKEAVQDATDAQDSPLPS